MKNNILYENLRVEMARENLTIQQLAIGMEMGRDTLSRKLAGKSELSLREAFDINHIFFPDKNIEYLFKEILQPIESAS